MNITKRLYTYPVLSNSKDDYIKSEFFVDFSHEMAGVNSLKLRFNIYMNCPKLQQCLINGEAEYLIHIECSSTAFRMVLKSKTPNFQYEIPISRINGLIEVVAFVVASRNIKNFSCDDWNEDFDGMSFDLNKGSILAYQNLKNLHIDKEYEQFSNASSIFMVYKRITNENKPVEVDMESNKIRIGLSSNDYSIYTRFYKRSEMQPILNSMIILPALVFVFEELKQEEGVERYKSRKWFIALENQYKKRGINLKNEILDEEKRSIILAQEAMDLPICDGLMQISNIYNDEEEEDDL